MYADLRDSDNIYRSTHGVQHEKYCYEEDNRCLENSMHHYKKELSPGSYDACN